jgi:hypothetical protein
MPTVKQKTKPHPRKLCDSDYRYTVDEILSLMVATSDAHVLLYDTCDMSEYSYHRPEMPEEDVKDFSAEKNSTDRVDLISMDSVFEAFTITSSDCSTYEDKYWKTLAPGTELLESCLIGPEAGYGDIAAECARTKLNAQPDDTVCIYAVPLVHVLPVGAVHEWLKFVGRNFSDIPRDAKNKHADLCSELV